MDQPIGCTCGKLTGTLAEPAAVNRGLCYCDDCQAFAHYLGRADDVLDAQGGTQVLQTEPRHLAIATGAEHLRCVRLSEQGLLRWYADCCKTPIGSTMANFKNAFVAIVDTCVASDPATWDEVFGPLAMVVNTKWARGEPKPRQYGLGRAFGKILRMLVRGRFTGSYRDSPFFDARTGEPRVAPAVLGRAERDALAAQAAQ